MIYTVNKNQTKHDSGGFCAGRLTSGLQGFGWLTVNTHRMLMVGFWSRTKSRASLRGLNTWTQIRQRLCQTENTAEPHLTVTHAEYFSSHKFQKCVFLKVQDQITGHGFIWRRFLFLAYCQERSTWVRRVSAENINTGPSTHSAV